MMGRRMMIGLHRRPGVPGVSMGLERTGRRCVVVVVIVPCRGRRRRAEGHRCGGEALKRHRQQRHPDDQDFQEGFHAAILAWAKVLAAAEELVDLGRS